MVYPLTGSNRGRGGLRVSTIDLNPDVYGVNYIRVSNGTLTNNGEGEVTITTGGGGGGGAITVRLSAGSVCVASGSPVSFYVDSGFTPTHDAGGHVTVGL